MKIGLITDSIRENSTGVGSYARTIIENILKQDIKNEYFFIDFQQTLFNSKKLIKIGNHFKILKTYLWHNYLPLKTKNLKLDYIFNFTAVPHIFPYKQKEIFFVYDISWYLYPEYHRRMRVLYYKFLFKVCLKNSFMIAVDSFSTKKDLINIFKISANKIIVIYPPFVDKIKESKKIQYKINYPYILFIGTFEPRKNITSIIKAFKKLKENEKIKEKLILCGKKGWLYEEIFELIKELSLNEDVVYLGYITDEEKKWLYKHAECFVYPSWYEGFGIPVLEAMAYGCPVITSNISSLPEVAGNACILVEPDNVDKLSEEMFKIIKNYKLGEKMRMEGYKQAAKFESLNIYNDIFNFLK